jgi:hypothetical protein
VTAELNDIIQYIAAPGSLIGNAWSWKKGIEGTVAIATGTLNAAKGVMSDLGDKAALDTAREILASTQQFGSKVISAAQATVDETDITTQVALNKAKQTLAAIAHGPEQGLVDSTKTTLNKFSSANQMSVFHSECRKRIIEHWYCRPLLCKSCPRNNCEHHPGCGICGLPNRVAVLRLPNNRPLGSRAYRLHWMWLLG